MDIAEKDTQRQRKFAPGDALILAIDDKTPLKHGKDFILTGNRVIKSENQEDLVGQLKNDNIYTVINQPAFPEAGYIEHEGSFYIKPQELMFGRYSFNEELFKKLDGQTK